MPPCCSGPANRPTCGRRSAPGLHRRPAARRADRRRPPSRCRAGRGRRRRSDTRGRGLRGGVAVSPKIAFVTPRYGLEVMGGAETAARNLAEHLRSQTDWEAEVHTTCALNPHTWADDLEPGTTRAQRGDGAPPPLGPRPPAGLLRPRRPGPPGAAPGDPCPGGAVGRLQRPGLPPADRRRSARRMPTWWPSTRTSTTRPWRPSARSRCRRCCTPRPTTSRRSTCPCSAARSATPTPSASTRRPSAPWWSGCTRWPSSPRSCSDSGWASRRAWDGPVGSCWGWVTAPTS